MNPRPGFLNWPGYLAAALTIGIVTLFALFQGNSIFSPGALNAQEGAALEGVTSHAGMSERCSACHTPFWGSDRMADRCLKCHQEIAAQQTDPQSLHGILMLNGFAPVCRNCHPDHRGSDAPLTLFEPAFFPHKGVDFPLEGKHLSIECIDCHVNQSFQNTPMDCNSCHAKQDIHAGQLGTDCSLCHTAIGWTPSLFDHNTSTFKLDGEHADTPCSNCHIDKVFNGTPSDCYSCHAEEDIHAGQLGTDCSLCHTPVGWTPSTFNHDTSTFKLDGKHSDAPCASCHIDKVFKGTPADCYSCHTKDDIHLGQLGTDCTKCHSTAGWIPSTFDHNTSVFILDGRHATLACTDCHLDKVFKGIPKDCFGCHAKDDRHNRRYGTSCSLCHSTSAWSPATFDHRFSAFPLTGAHANLDCSQCHANNVFVGTPTFCGACHGDPPYHAGLFSSNCAACHDTSSWLPAAYNLPHNFNIYHEGSNGNCRNCHPSSLARYDCSSCHKDGIPNDGNGGDD